MASQRVTTLARRPTLADLRSVTGLIIGLYVTMHLSNHPLGLISVRAQEAVRPWVMALWHSPPGKVLLYGSLSVHATIALIVLFRRRQYHMPPMRLSHEYRQISLVLLVLEVAALDESALREIL
jgi:adenylate cyclase